ncbi:MAG TPA: ROK family transcriptional regulator [Gemmatimonadaceae bacterium]
MRKINTRSFRLATRATPREVNRQIVLNLIREFQPISRAELARRMNVRRAALTAIVRDLIANGDVEETGTAIAARGRRPTLMRIRTTDRTALAVDVRPGVTVVALVDYGGKVLERTTFDTSSDPAELSRVLGVALKGMIVRLAGTPIGDGCQGVGIVVPGMVDKRSGHVLYAPRLGWRDVPLRDSIAEVTGLQVYVESAPIACALARLWSVTRTRTVNNFVYVSVSDGVGVGIVNRGEVLRGETHTAGEFGHVSLDPNGPLCACGKRGCWEAFASNSATIARYNDAAKRKDTATIEEIVRRAKEDEPAARDAVIETGHQIGRGLAAVVSALNPKRIYIGGEVTAAWDLIEGPIRDELMKNTLTEAAHMTPVYPDEKTEVYRLLGAVALVAAPGFAAPRVG